MTGPGTLGQRERLAAASDFIQREARLIDQGSWDDWLACYADDCVFWAPAWRSDGTLTDNPLREISHIYVVGKGGLEDRIFRIGSRHAAASVPMQRTTHILSSSQAIAPPQGDGVVLRTSWNCHVYFPRGKRFETFFGYYEHTLIQEEEWKIMRKKIVINNDYIPTLMDFYCI